MQGRTCHSSWDTRSIYKTKKEGIKNKCKAIEDGKQEIAEQITNDVNGRV